MGNTAKTYIFCRFCNNKRLIKTIDLGDMPLAGGFLRKEDFDKENFYPLTLYFCSSCYLLQTNVVIERDVLFKNYFYFSSAIKTLTDHFGKTADEFSSMFVSPKNKKILEIGCNDGGFLLAARKKGFEVIGVDPAKNVVKKIDKRDITIINDYFTENVSQKVIKKFGHVDIVFSSNTLAHIEDMHDVVKGIKNVLSPDGILVFDVHYVGKLIEESQYDMIYHEHQYYYSLHALKNLFSQHDMEVFDVQSIAIHAGSIRCYIQKKGAKQKIHSRVGKLLTAEVNKGLTKAKYFIAFDQKIKKEKKELLLLLKLLKKQNKKIVGYGASGRGTIIMNYCGLNGEYIDYVIDDAPAKQGFYMPGLHTQIVSSDYLYSYKPDYVVLFAWPFEQEIKKKHTLFFKKGGKFIVPLPQVKII